MQQLVHRARSVAVRRASDCPRVPREFQGISAGTSGRRAKSRRPSFPSFAKRSVAAILRVASRSSARSYNPTYDSRSTVHPSPGVRHVQRRHRDGSALAALARPHARRREPRDEPPRVLGRRVQTGTRLQPAPTSGSSDQGAGPQSRAPPQGRGRGRGQPAEGRPLVSIACKDFDTKNVAWKLPLPAYSGSTPIIWGNTIFLNVATAANTGSIELWAIDRNKPAVKWKRLLVEANNMQRKQNSVVPVAGHRRQARLGDDGVRRLQGVRLRRQGDLVARSAGRLREVRAEPWIRVVAAASARRAVRAGAAWNENGTILSVRPQDRQDDGQDGVARRKADAGCQRISRPRHHAGVGRGQRPRRADHHGR